MVAENSNKLKLNFAGFSGTNSRKKRPISWELPEQMSLESDWFCADLGKVFNETRRSYSIYPGFMPQYEIILLIQVSLLNIIKTNKRIRILKTHLLF